MATTDAPLAAVPALPPHSLEAERAVLGAILLAEKTLYGLVIGAGLRPADFYRPQHGAIYKAMLALYDAGEPVDAVTVKEWLLSRGKLEEAGGDTAIDLLAAPVPAVGHLRQYAEIVKSRALVRRLLDASYGIQHSVFAHEAEPRELVERAERAILEVAHDESQRDLRPITDVLQVELERLHELSVLKTALTGTPSGFKDLDEITGGFQAGNLIVIAARPSMGKSALVVNMAENAAITHGKAVVLFSLEMSEAELAQRFIASQSNTRGDDLRKGRVDETKWPKILAACDRLSQAPLYIDDSSDVGVLEVRAKCRRLAAKHREGLGLVIVDYLQLMRADQAIENRVLQIGEMSRGLKILAGELKVPVIALSQLSRAVEQRHDKRPILSDLRESGSIEQDADVVMFIYRDDYYDKESERQGEADLIISKHRNGRLGDVQLVFKSELPKFLTHAGDRFGG